jgi:hypothetical protein
MLERISRWCDRGPSPHTDPARPACASKHPCQRFSGLNRVLKILPRMLELCILIQYYRFKKKNNMRVSRQKSKKCVKCADYGLGLHRYP